MIKYGSSKTESNLKSLVQKSQFSDFIKDNFHFICNLLKEKLYQSKSTEINEIKYFYNCAFIFVQKLKKQHINIKYELLNKTLWKLDKKNFNDLFKINLITFNITGYKRNKGNIFYIIEFCDKIEEVVWKFKARYSELRKINNEIKNSKRV